MAGKYRWSHPIEWLEEKLNGLSEPNKLHEFAIAMMSKLDSDDIQDLFQSDMEADGYFEPIIEDAKESSQEESDAKR